ncbi:hypothetical protein EMPS_10859 [Entomortierella parvispora]|uniref:Uncharacterized protein n=1 Tax=Entomortierella parvispora TaxID=205924 RepID=A0A9P3HKZ4_9FUNG|nr:hypothetical protein EMPS_10859 [Entomortierella parvispora]
MAKTSKTPQVEEEGNLGTSSGEVVVPTEVVEDVPEEDSHMEVDDETFDEPLTLESAQNCLKKQGQLLKSKTDQRVTLGRKSMGPSSKTPAHKAALEKVKEEIQGIKESIVEWSAIVEDLNKSREAERLSTTRPTMIKSTTGALVATGAAKSSDESEIKLTTDIPRYHRSVDPSLMPAIDSKSSGPIITNVRIFLHEFRTICQLKYGHLAFQKICFRLLSLANLDRKAADAFVVTREADRGSEWDWERCEQEFVDAALTPLEKALEVDEFAKAGREKGESYKELQYRLKRLVEVYRVKELPKHADVTQTLRMSIPSLTFTVMQIAEVQKRMLAHIGMAMPETGTLDFLMDSIPHAYGPDDCTEWKTVIDEARRRRVLKEGEDAKKNKKPVTNGSSANSNESNTHSNHQGAPASGYSYQAPYRGYRGGRSGYRGGNYNTNRGSYRGAPYHRHEGECEEYVDEAEAGSDDVINNNTVAITKEVTSLKDKSLLEETHPEVAKESAEDERGVVVATAEEEQSEEECEEVIAIEETHTEQGKTKVEASSEEIKMEQKPETATKKKKKRKARKRMPANGGVRVKTREDIVKTMIAVLEERERRSASGDSEGSSKEAEEAEVKFAAATMVEEIAADPDVEDAQATEHEGYMIEHDVVTSSNLCHSNRQAASCISMQARRQEKKTTASLSRLLSDRSDTMH